MKKLFLIFTFILVTVFANCQDTPPSGENFKSIPTYRIKYYTTDSTVWIYKGSTYGWTEIPRNNHIWWTEITNIVDTDTTFVRVNNKDTVNLFIYKLKSDSTELPGYFTQYDATLKEDKSNKVTSLSGGSTDTEYPSAKLTYDQLALKAPVDDPTFTTKITTPALNIPTSATENYFWKCTNAGTGAGAWTAVAATQTYKGVWNANTNTPELADGTGTAGWYYICNVAGTTDFGAGNITFAVGDQASYTGAIWEKIPVSIAVNLTGPITSVGNATSIAAQTGTGTTFAMSASPTLTGSLTVKVADGANNGISVIPTSALDATHIGWYASHRSNNEDLWIFGYDGTDFKNFAQFDWSTGYTSFMADNVGINIAAPLHPLHLSLTGDYISITDSGDSDKDRVRLGESAGNGGYLGLYNETETLTALIRSYGVTYFNGGNVGIGTTSPGTKLEVDGVITATGGTSNQWNAAYTDRLKWDGGSTGLTAATGRTSLGGTTVGQAFFMLTNPSAITFARINANNTVTALSAADFRTAIGTAAANQTMYIGTTAVAINRGSAALTLAGITLTTPNIGTPSAGALTNCTNADWDAAYSWGDHSGAGYALLNSSPTFTGTVTATNFILSSDRRLKTNIRNIDTKGIDIKYKQFEMKSDRGQMRYGVIAQDLQKNNPELVRTDKDGMLSVAYVDLLIKEIASLKQRVMELEKYQTKKSRRHEK